MQRATAAWLFDGVHLDIEPWTRRDWPGREQELLAGLERTVKDVAARTALPVEVDLSPWLADVHPAAFAAIVDTGYADVVRPFTPGPGTYTYWDYQQLAFPKKRGLRIDFILASQALATRVDNAWIDREERKGKGASDHAPVVIEIG